MVERATALHAIASRVAAEAGATDYVVGGTTFLLVLGAGTSLVARGEFSVILSQLAVGGVALDTAFRGKVGAFSGGFVVLTTFTGVLLMRESRRIGRWLFRSANTRNAERKGS